MKTRRRGWVLALAWLAPATAAVPRLNAAPAPVAPANATSAYAGSPPAGPPPPTGPAHGGQPPAARPRAGQARVSKPSASRLELAGNQAFVRLQAPSFTRVTARQRMLAYHLAQAAIQLDPIFYDQMAPYGLKAKRLLGALVERPERLPEELRQPILDYAKLFFGNHGNRDSSSARKLLPGLTFEQLARAAEQARAKGARLGTPAALAALLAELQAPLFDPAREAALADPPSGGPRSLLAAFADNFYRGVTLADLKGFSETHPLNSRLVKRGGKLVEEVWRAGTPDGQVPAGLYAAQLAAVNRELEEAARLAEPEQAGVIRALERFYQTGEARDWSDFNLLWLASDPAVDFISGFIACRRDARGIKGSAQMLVAVTDQKLDALLKKLAANAAYFDSKAPWDPRFKSVPPAIPAAPATPIVKAVEAVIASGDWEVGAFDEQLPSEREIRERHGSKSLLISSAAAALAAARGAREAEEFSANAGDAEQSERYGALAESLRAALREVVGRGTGKAGPVHDPAASAREVDSTLELARAELSALWSISDPKLAELGVAEIADPANLGNLSKVAHELYRQLARRGLTTLARYPTGTTADEVHDRAELLAVHYLIAAGVFERLQRDGHQYIAVKDFERAHATVGTLLAEIVRILAEHDLAAGRALIEKYAAHFDPAVRDDVVARYSKLQFPVAFHGIYPDLIPVTDQSGQIIDVELSQPRDFLQQQLYFARRNRTLGF
ncbi:MAG TPA: hypothetical protein VHR45_07950 [Thermoanaerobaculia bacterium]|nr:hypothetical protein [Thermoanaerobaculia bacterium]